MPKNPTARLCSGRLQRRPDSTGWKRMVILLRKAWECPCKIMEKNKENDYVLNSFLLTHCRHWLYPVPGTFSKGKFWNPQMNSLAKSKRRWTENDFLSLTVIKTTLTRGRSFFLFLDTHSGISILLNIYFIYILSFPGSQSYHLGVSLFFAF